jgi:RsiW-degrading membrane proteinase PrsW (M82 family)
MDIMSKNTLWHLMFYVLYAIITIMFVYLIYCIISNNSSEMSSWVTQKLMELFSN